MNDFDRNGRPDNGIWNEAADPMERQGKTMPSGCTAAESHAKYHPGHAGRKQQVRYVKRDLLECDSAASPQYPPVASPASGFLTNTTLFIR